MFKHMPNRLTLARVLLAPVFIAAFYHMQPWSLWIALLVAVTIEVTDGLDGYLARRRGQVSEVGKFFDPFADSVARFSEFLAFYAVSVKLNADGSKADLYGMMGLWMITIIFYRDVLVAYLRIAAANRNYIISARLTGKIKAGVQGTAVIIITFMAATQPWFGLSWKLISGIGFWLLAGVTMVTFLSGVDYVWGNRKLLRSEKETE